MYTELISVLLVTEDVAPRSLARHSAREESSLADFIACQETKRMPPIDERRPAQLRSEAPSTGIPRRQEKRVH